MNGTGATTAFANRRRNFLHLCDISMTFD